MKNGQNADMTLKEVILKISEWLLYIRIKWKVVLAAFVIGAVLGLVLSVASDTKYTAELSFVVEGDELSSGALGMYAGVARQLGFDLGRSGAGSVFSEENLQGLLQSRLLIERVLLSPVDSGVNGRNLADYYIYKHEVQKKWGIDNGDLFVLPSTVSRDSLSLDQSRILKKMYTMILEDHLTVEKGEKTSFISVKCTSRDEFFSKLFVERLMSEAVDFYTATKTKKARESIVRLQDKADSIEAVLNDQTFAVASSQDLNRNPARQVATVGVELAMRDQQILQSIYIEVVKNLEISKISLLREMPVIQIIDRPTLPLKRESPSPVIWGIAGALLGLLLSSFILLVRYIFKEIMRS